MIKKEEVKFVQWLEAHGCEVLPTTNEYEQVRFKGIEVGVLYASGKCSNQYTANAIEAFKNQNKKWYGAPVSTGRQPGYRKEKRKLLDRDGDCCFLCGDPLENDITIEHLIALNSGGRNNLLNMVLCHYQCNVRLGTLPVSIKVRLAIDLRMKREIHLLTKPESK